MLRGVPRSVFTYSSPGMAESESRKRSFSSSSTETSSKKQKLNAMASPSLPNIASNTEPPIHRTEDQNHGNSDDYSNSDEDEEREEDELEEQSNRKLDKSDSSSARAGADGGRISTLRNAGSKDNDKGLTPSPSRQFYPSRESMTYFLEWMHAGDIAKLRCQRCLNAKRQCAWVKHYAKCACCEKRRLTCSTFQTFTAEWKRVKGTYKEPPVPPPPFPPNSNHPLWLSEDDTLHPNNYSRPPSDPNPRLYTILLIELEKVYNKKNGIASTPSATVNRKRKYKDYSKINSSDSRSIKLHLPSSGKTTSANEDRPTKSKMDTSWEDNTDDSDADPGSGEMPTTSPERQPESKRIDSTRENGMAPRLFRKSRNMESSDTLDSVYRHPDRSSMDVDKRTNSTDNDSLRPRGSERPQDTESNSEAIEKLNSRLHDQYADNLELKAENIRLRRLVETLEEKQRSERQERDEFREKYLYAKAALADAKAARQDNSSHSSNTADELDRLHHSLKQANDSLRNMCEEILSLDPFASDVSSVLVQRHSMSMFYSASLILANLPGRGDRKKFECSLEQEKFMVQMYLKTMKDRKI